MANVTLVNIAKLYPKVERPAVDNISLEVHDGEFLVLVGPSGCGKSTTLRMIAGLEEVSAGEIRIGGRRVNELPPKDRDIAMVFQNYALYPHMTVYNNMAFGLKLRKFPRAEIDRRVRDASEILGLNDYLDRKPAALSGGQRQRVAVGRAIVRQPQVFLFDEPLSNLDAKMRVQMRAELGRLHARLGTTMIYVTHDQTEAMTMGDRIVVMDGGTIQQIDAPLALYDRPANRFVAGFIGSPPMNFIEGRVSDEGGELVFADEGGGVRFSVAPEHRESLRAVVGRPISFGIRPERFFHPDSAQRPGAAAREIVARVEVVEPMGNEMFLYLTTGATQLVARVDSHVRARRDEELTLTMDVATGHYFDRATGDTLAEARAAA